MEFESNSKSTSSLFNSREPSKEQESEDSLNILLNQSSSSISESKAAHKEGNKTNEQIESAESALNEFYKLKNKYENEPTTKTTNATNAIISAK